MACFASNGLNVFIDKFLAKKNLFKKIQCFASLAGGSFIIGGSRVEHDPPNWPCRLSLVGLLQRLQILMTVSLAYPLKNALQF